jgi:hypothetical protein
MMNVPNGPFSHCEPFLCYWLITAYSAIPVHGSVCANRTLVSVKEWHHASLSASHFDPIARRVGRF